MLEFFGFVFSANSICAGPKVDGITPSSALEMHTSSGHYQVSLLEYSKFIHKKRLRTNACVHVHVVNRNKLFLSNSNVSIKIHKHISFTNNCIHYMRAIAGEWDA